MRLGQLARKLALRQSEVLAFLATHHIHVEEGSNTKVEDNHVALVMQHFSPGQVVAKDFNEAPFNDPFPIGEISIKETELAVTQIEETGFSSVTHQIQETKPVEEQEAEVLTPESKFREEDAEEVIRAPKVELPGLKVIGKIEIAELKKKETLLQEETPSIEQHRVSEVETRPKIDKDRRAGRPRESQDRRPKANPIALQRESEAYEAAQKKREEIERQKELRTQRYLKKVKIAPPIKAAKITDEPLEELHAVPADNPKTLWGKFVKWLKS